MISKKIGLPKYISDKRIIDRNIRKKLISQKEYEEYLKTLPDETQSVDQIKIETDVQYDA